MAEGEGVGVVVVVVVLGVVADLLELLAPDLEPLDALELLGAGALLFDEVVVVDGRVAGADRRGGVRLVVVVSETNSVEP